MKEKKPKMTRKERERQMIAEMESALWERKDAETPQNGATEPLKTENKKTAKESGSKSEQKVHCSRCKTLMENGKCPNCGHYIYVPMDKEKRDKIRWIVGGICVVGFVIFFVIMQIKN